MNKTFKTYSAAFILAFCALASACTCKDDEVKFDVTIYNPQYATGFDILGTQNGQSVILVTKSPWQGANSTTTTSLLISRNGEKIPKGFKGQTINKIPERIVCMSSSHVAMLETIGMAERVVGVSGINFITNATVRSRQSSIGDVGFDNSMNYELLVSLQPDIVILYGVNGSNVIEPKLRELKIPFVYIGEYLEESPLGKAEWVVAISEIMGCRQHGIETFNKIPEQYHKLKNLAASTIERPKVMINTPYADSWVMASTDSYVAQLIKDAAGCYIYEKNTSNQSEPVDMEEAYLMASHSDYWINTGAFTSLQLLKERYPKFADTKPVITGNVYNCNLRTNPYGGNDYWESGVVRPDLVLRDLIKIFHPELLAEEPFIYYKKL